ncbi:MAG TPA: GntR family transcriptional regulator, partial [Acidimicrobiales bacterium]|nr:GntR family transcriptional regulator [Acidimicrobiales bacterium]
SLYDLLGERYQRRPTHGREVVDPVAADRRVAKLLGVKAGTPVLLVERTAFDENDVPVEYANDVFAGDRTRLVVWSYEVPRH